MEIHVLLDEQYMYITYQAWRIIFYIKLNINLLFLLILLLYEFHV